MKVLELMKENKDASRKGMFCSGIVSTVGDQKMALFFTGRKHAGENLKDVLSKRTPGMKPPIQMCDALSRNAPEEFVTLMANCLAHGRRNFVDIVWSFPEECAYVLEQLKKVYKNDALAKEQNLNPDERLVFHQENSQSVMDGLYEWFRSQLGDCPRMPFPPNSLSCPKKLSSEYQPYACGNFFGHSSILEKIAILGQPPR